MKEIGGESGVYVRSVRDLVPTLILAGSQYPDRQIEIFSHTDKGRILAEGFVPAVHIAVQTTGTCPGAAVPEIPVGGNGCSRVNILFRK